MSDPTRHGTDPQPQNFASQARAWAIGLNFVYGVVGFAAMGCASETGLARPKTPVLDPFESQSPSEAQVCAIQTKAPVAKTEAASAPSEEQPKKSRRLPPRSQQVANLRPKPQSKKSRR